MDGEYIASLLNKRNHWFVAMNKPQSAVRWNIGTCMPGCLRHKPYLEDGHWLPGVGR